MTGYTEFRSRGLEILFFFLSFFLRFFRKYGPPRNNRSRVFCHAFDREARCQRKKIFYACHCYARPL